MADKHKQTGTGKSINEGHQPADHVDFGEQPLKKGYQVTSGNLDITKPPTGGSGVPSSDSTNNTNKE